MVIYQKVHIVAQLLEWMLKIPKNLFRRCPLTPFSEHSQCQELSSANSKNGMDEKSKK